MALAYPSGYNTWVPSWEATGQVISFIRNPKMFKINDYVAFRPATKSVGLYLTFDLENPARSLSLDQMVWPEGSERPTGEQNMGGFQFDQFRTIRRDLAVTLGRKTIAQTDWPILALNTSMVMAQAMTALTRQTLTVLDTAGNWGSYTVAATAAGSGAGKFELANATPGDVNYMNILKVFNYALQQINLNTNGMVQADQVCAIIGVDAARIMRQSAELVDFVKQSPFAQAQIRGEITNRNVKFGLPERLYGVDLIVEDTVQVTSKKGATTARSYVKNSDNIVFMSKQDVLPGDQVGDAPTPNFSTYQVFYYSGAESNQGSGPSASGLLQVETWDDVRNKRTEAHVTWDTAEVLVNPSSGLLVTDCFSSL